MALVLKAKSTARRVLDADALFDSRAAALALHRKHVLCLGDSHVHVLRHVRRRGVLFDVHPVKGATASGILNPNSVTGALPLFTALLDRARPWQHVLLHLGEVDCGFVIWHRAQRHGIPVEQQLAETVDAYAAFIASVHDRPLRSTAVLSAPLPTIADYPEEWGDVANMRREVTATQAQRTDLTLRFNALVKERCDGLGIVYLDATTGQLDARTGLLDATFVKRNSRNHHLRSGPYAALVEAELARARWP
ncbi:MAG TPA: hypothetical protein VGU02_10680 [Gaiellaceae bacterium]|nr:hypothetical protein [Gaiellaceae bacterium]